MKNISTLLLFWFISTSCFAQDIIRGIVRDSATNQPIQYVNVGILDKGVGTVTNADGAFKIVFNESIQSSDTIKFSMVGYQSQVFSVKNIKSTLDAEKQTTIILKETVLELPPMMITSKPMKMKTLGNKTESTFFGGGFGSQHLGSEIGIKLNIKHENTFIRNMNFFISYNRFDSLTFRVNIYDFADKMPGENLLKKNVIVKLGNQSGRITVDLSEYNIVVNDDVLVSLEWIGKYGEIEASVLVLSGSFLNANTYLRRASQGKWESKSLGLGINATVLYED